jgi:carboxyl-terminal processing protease
MASRTRLVVLLVSTPILAFVVVGGFLGKVNARSADDSRFLRVFEDVLSLVLNNYVERVDLPRVMTGAMHGLADGLDADTAYLTPEEVKSLEAPAAGQGVGLELTRQYYLRIVSARDGSPAAAAGLRTGDYIRAIDGKSTRDMSVFTGMRLLRGAPGTKVTLTVLRGSAAEPHTVDVVRGSEGTSSLASRIAAPGIGYLRIPAFGAGTPSDLKATVAALGRQGATRLIVDVRGTAQGPIEAGIDAARLFVGSGTLVIREARNQGRDAIAAAASDGSITLPVLLLTTNGTSGAAELFVAALSGNKRAQVVGERTLGRAGLQKLVPLPDGSGLWLTHARYLTPGATPIHGTGIEPHVEVAEPDVEFGAAPPETDPILQKALEQFAGKAAA